MDILIWLVTTVISLVLSFFISIAIWRSVDEESYYEDLYERMTVPVVIWGLSFCGLTVFFMGLFQFIVFKVIL